MGDKFINIHDMMNRDINNEVNSKLNNKLYQVQAHKNDSDVNIVYMGNFSFLPISEILKLQVDSHMCKLMSLLITEHDVINLEYKNMIGFFIYNKKNKHISSLMYGYLSKEKKFAICLIKKNKEHEIIEKYNKYHGGEESIYLLTEVLLDKNVKKKLFS